MHETNPKENSKGFKNAVDIGNAVYLKLNLYASNQVYCQNPPSPEDGYKIHNFSCNMQSRIIWHTKIQEYIYSSQEIRQPTNANPRVISVVKLILPLRSY